MDAIARVPLWQDKVHAASCLCKLCSNLPRWGLRRCPCNNGIFSSGQLHISSWRTSVVHCKQILFGFQHWTDLLRRQDSLVPLSQAQIIGLPSCHFPVCACLIPPERVRNPAGRALLCEGLQCVLHLACFMPPQQQYGRKPFSVRAFALCSSCLLGAPPASARQGSHLCEGLHFVLHLPCCVLPQHQHGRVACVRQVSRNTLMLIRHQRTSMGPSVGPGELNASSASRCRAGEGSSRHAQHSLQAGQIAQMPKFNAMLTCPAPHVPPLLPALHLIHLVPSD